MTYTHLFQDTIFPITRASYLLVSIVYYFKIKFSPKRAEHHNCFFKNSPRQIGLVLWQIFAIYNKGNTAIFYCIQCTIFLIWATLQPMWRQFHTVHKYIFHGSRIYINMDYQIVIDQAKQKNIH